VPGRPRDAGSATAEFAVALPAVLMLLALLLGAVQMGATQVAAQDAAADAARGLGRGEGFDAVRAWLARQLPGASLAVTHDGDLVCVRVAVPGTGPAAVLGLRPQARACALDGGG